MGVGKLLLPIVISYQPGGGEQRREAPRTAPRARQISKSPRSTKIGRRSWPFLVPSNSRVKKALYFFFTSAWEKRLTAPPTSSSPWAFSLPVQFCARFGNSRASGAREVRGFELP